MNKKFVISKIISKWNSFGYIYEVWLLLSKLWLQLNEI